MNKLYLIAILLLTQGCATYMQALDGGTVLYKGAGANDRVTVCKYEFQRMISYPQTIKFWNTEQIDSYPNYIVFISGSYKRYDGSADFKQLKCVLDDYTIDGKRYVGIKGINSLHPVGPAIGWTRDGKTINRY